MDMTNAEYDKIVAATRLYIDGFNDRDVEKFKKAFHEDAMMFFTNEEGKLHIFHLNDEVFEGWAAEDEKRPPVELRIISVAQMGDAASVALHFGDDWLDFHNLARVDGEWKITNKTASHSSR
jgi:ketosteroid isomerase-like protein